MADKDDAALSLDASQQAEEKADERRVYLRNGRTLSVGSEGLDDVVELRAESGQLELRIRVTESGPVLQLDAVRVSLKAAESVDVECKKFSVNASEGVSLATDGELSVTSQKDMRITSTEELIVKGKMIYLN